MQASIQAPAPIRRRARRTITQVAGCSWSLPNVVAVERELRVDPSDFRLWVCLHEETHRVQFTAVPWLREYLNTQIHEVVANTELDTAAMAQMLRDGIKKVAESCAASRRSRSSTSSRRRPSARSSTGSRR